MRFSSVEIHRGVLFMCPATIHTNHHRCLYVIFDDVTQCALSSRSSSQRGQYPFKSCSNPVSFCSHVWHGEPTNSRGIPFSFSFARNTGDFYSFRGMVHFQLRTKRHQVNRFFFPLHAKGKNSFFERLTTLDSIRFCCTQVNHHCYLLQNLNPNLTRPSEIHGRSLVALAYCTGHFYCARGLDNYFFPYHHPSRILG